MEDEREQALAHFGIDLEYERALAHYGVKGMKWGVRKAEKLAYRVGAKLNPRELKYAARKATNRVTDSVRAMADLVRRDSARTGILPTDEKMMKALESEGIAKHRATKYDNLDSTDIKRFKEYTDSARFSRSVNTYLAVGTPKDHAKEAEELKQSLRKNKIDDQVVYRSCNYNFTTNGLAKKMDQYGEAGLAQVASQVSKGFKGKSVQENRVFSTSTSPLFAIDTWRKVNPTAAANYNSYMIINCKGVSGVYADGKTSKGKSLVNTKSNQECILAPEKLVYQKVEYDKKRGMFAITVDAVG